MKFCWIPGTNGKATGSPKTEKQRHESEAEHDVDLDGFWLAKYQINQNEYVKITGKENPSYFRESMCWRIQGDRNEARMIFQWRVYRGMMPQ